MDKKANLDLFLTEISFELLGNSMYDISGKKQNSLIGIFKAVGTENLNSDDNDLLKSLDYPTSINQLNHTDCKEFLDEQYRFMLNVEKMRSKSAEIDAKIKELTDNKAKFYGATTEHQIRKGGEHSKLLLLLNKKRLKAFTNEFLDSKKNEAVEKYYENERNELFTNCMDTIRLIKFMLRDPKNESHRTEMLATALAFKKYMDELPH